MTEVRLGGSRVQARTAAEIGTSAGVGTSRFEAWYVAGALVSGVAYGMLPMLLPQFVVLRGGDARSVGLVMAALMLGCLFAPMWRGLAERHRIHRTLAIFLTGLAATALLWLATGGDEIRWMIGAAIVGTCCTGATVIGGLYVTDRQPRDDWPKRQGVAVQTFATGIAGGLVFAAAFSGASFVPDGLVFGALALVLATGMAVVWMPSMLRRRRHTTRGEVMDFEGHPVMHQAPDPHALVREGDTRWKLAFALFLVGIALLTMASAALLFQYPLMAPEAFGLDPAGAALVFGGAALASVVWYPAVGRTARTRDPVDLIIRATWMRAIVFGELALLTLVVDPWVTLAAAALFFVYRNTWPSVYSGITECSFELVPQERRRLAMGMLSITLAVGAVGAGVFSGYAVTELGYDRFALGIFAFALAAGFVFSTLRVWRRYLFATAWA